MTNDLTAQHLAVINKLQGFNVTAATSCAAITVEWMKGFSEWVGKSKWKWQIIHDIWYNAPLEREATTDELINLYFEHLNKKQ